MSETSPIAEQANPETELARDRCSPEDLPHDALQTVPRTEPVVQVENLFGGAGRTQEEEEEEDEEEEEELTVKPVGQAFEDNMKMIRSWLMDDEISTIGICGMGGNGKTTILIHIHNELLQRPDISHHVYWVTVSQDLSIYRLQNLIARHLDLDLPSEYDILPRAAKLSEELRKKQEWILILDDLWESFELSEVGIPVPLKGCKVIFTTRSNAVCQRMGSQVITKVIRPLSEREALTLFIEHLGHGIALSPKLERIAADIARECAGLPLGIITMAGSLRSEDDPDEWRHTLEKLKESNFGDMEDKVFRVLRISYDRLDDFKLQQCLLCCASFPEDYIIEREELIFYLIDGGIIEKMRSREATFDKGHVMLNRLEYAGLLQRIDGGRAVKMHDLIRDMAVCICKENPSVMEQRRMGIEMAVSNIDPFWNHVEQTNDGIMKCVFCGHLFAKNTSISRIKVHLARERGRGVRICGQVPKQVQEAAFLSMHGGNSCSPEELPHDTFHSSGGLRHNRSEARGAPLLTGSTKLVGRAFEENRNVIWSWLTDDEVSIIDIYGMAGAGKTRLLKHICNELQRSPDIYYPVYWVTLSPDFSIHKLQNKIAKCIQLSFSNEEQELGLRAEKLSQKLMKKQRCWKEEELGRRAKELSQELMKKQRWILILDNLCNSFV